MASLVFPPTQSRMMMMTTVIHLWWHHFWKENFSWSGMHLDLQIETSVLNIEQKARKKVTYIWIALVKPKRTQWDTLRLYFSFQFCYFITWFTRLTVSFFFLTTFFVLILRMHTYLHTWRCSMYTSFIFNTSSVRLLKNSFHDNGHVHKFICIYILLLLDLWTKENNDKVVYPKASIEVSESNKM